MLSFFYGLDIQSIKSSPLNHILLLDFLINYACKKGTCASIRQVKKSILYPPTNVLVNSILSSIGFEVHVKMIVRPDQDKGQVIELFRVCYNSFKRK